MNNTAQMSRLDKKVRRWVKQWPDMPINRELFLTEPSSVISDYLDDKTDHFTLSQASLDLSIWHTINYEKDLLSGISSSEHLCLASLYSGQSLALARTLIAEGLNISILPNDASLSLGLAAAANQKDEFTARHEILIEGLTSPLLDFSTSTNPKNEKGELFSHLWFMMKLHLKTMNVELDVSNISHPAHLLPYERALENWDARDEKIVQSLISEMAEFHISNTTPITPDDIAEFDYEYTMLFPYEIITFLQIRTWNGLANPEKFDHPLMSHPLSLHQTATHAQLPESFRNAVLKFNCRREHQAV